MDSDMSGTVNAGELGVFIQRGKKLNAKHAKLGKQELSGSTKSPAPSSLAGSYPRGRKHQQDGQLSPTASAVAAAGHARGLMIEQNKVHVACAIEEIEDRIERLHHASSVQFQGKRGDDSLDKHANGDASPVGEDPERSETELLEKRAILRRQESQIQQMQDQHERDMDMILTMY